MPCPQGKHCATRTVISVLLLATLAIAGAALVPAVYDSRLILAYCAAMALRPSVYVYGGPQERDVRFATIIAAEEGVNLEVVDKDDRPSSARGIRRHRVTATFLAPTDTGTRRIFHKRCGDMRG